MNVSQYVSRFINGTNQSLFLTGKAGTGKTTLLKQIVATTHKKTVIAAPTGIAAINAGGVTLHSLFHLPFGSYIPEQTLPSFGNITFQVTTPATLLRNLKMNTQKRALIREMELLIIDEVSMLRADLMDAMDKILRYVRHNQKPFGGLQILFIGDLWQLPPVVKKEEWDMLKNYYSNIFFFNAQVFKRTELVYLELEKIFRQSDPEFIDLLNHFRLNKISEDDITLLNKQYKPNFNLLDHEGYIYLTTHNHKADTVNKKALDSLPGKSFRFKADIQGDFNEHSFPVDPVLELKEGAQVMFIKNDYSGNQAYFNGKIGKVEYIDDEHVEVAFTDGSPSATVEPYTWENKKFAIHAETKEIEERVTGTFTHYPIKLAWAITIHKSQGLTFDKAMIDISQVFAAGQTYVALSRLTSLQGLVLAEPFQWHGLKTDQYLFDFAQTKISDLEVYQKYQEASKQFVNEKVAEAFNFHELASDIQEHIGTYNKDVAKSAKQKYLVWAQSLLQKTKEKMVVCEKFQNQLKQIIYSGNDDYLNHLKERITAAKKYFLPWLNDMQEEVFLHMEKVRAAKGIKKYLKELKTLQGAFYDHTIHIYKAEALCEAVLNNRELNKSSLQKITQSVKKPEKEEKPKKKDQGRLKGKKKIKTEQVTYELYKKGKTTQEIALERGLTVRTIEGHMAKCVGQEKIDISELLTPEKIEIITDAFETFDTLRLNPIKEYLGDDYSYSEIKYVKEWMKLTRNIKE
ncbi:MAG: helix-turn-helix domain-containing protein [Bacteroidota bacterium]|nr:helix-turn-helix domain-containing protein [Bacteroidota bacterium]